METGSPIVDLRQALAIRFPHLHWTLDQRKPAVTMPTGIATLDLLLGGGLPRGEFTELVASGPGSGSAEVLHELLRRVALNRQFLALVDGMGSFDIGAVEPTVLARLLWVRCRQTSEALKATDLLLRDRNFPLVVLDLKLNPAMELRKIGASTWHRYGRLIEHHQTILLVITPQAMVNGADNRVAVMSGLGIDALEQSRGELLARLRFKLLRTGAEAQSELVAKAS